GHHRRSRLQLAAPIAIESRLREDLARQAHAGAHLLPVLGSGHVVEADPGLVERLGGSQAHPPLAARAHWPRVRLKAVLARECRAVIIHRQRQEMKLDVRVAHPGAAADEAAGLEVIAGAEAVLGEEPARADERAAHDRYLRIKRDGLAAGDLEVELQMILQVLAHTRQFAHHADAVGGELAFRADAGEHQQLARGDWSCTTDDLAPYAYLVKRPAAAIANADRPPPLEQYARGERVST